MLNKWGFLMLLDLNSKFYILNSKLPGPRSTFVESPLHFHLFLQNEPILKKPNMNLNHYPTTNYEKLHPFAKLKNEPIFREPIGRAVGC